MKLHYASLVAVLFAAARQLDELSPLHHLAEGHAITAGVLAVLWLSLAYALYTLAAKRRKKK